MSVKGRYLNLNERKREMNNTGNESEVVADVVTVQRKKNTGAVIASVAAALAAGAAVAWTTVPAVRNYVKMTFMKPENYCSWVYQTATDRISSAAGNSDFAGMNGAELSLRLNLDDSFMEPFRTQTASPLFSTLELGVNTVGADNRRRADIGLTADGKHVISADTAADDGRVYVRIPEISSKYYSYEGVKEIKGISLDADAASETVTAEEVSELSEKYGSIFSEFINDADSRLEKGAEGMVINVGYKYNKITTEFTPELVSALYGRLADEISSDEILNRIYESEIIDELTGELRESAETSENSFTLVTMVDANGMIKGLDYTGHNQKTGEETGKADFIFASRYSSFAFELNAPDVKVSADGTETAGRYTGEFTLGSDENKTKVFFEDAFIEENRFINGIISLNAAELTDGYANRISLLFEREDDTQTIKTEIPDFGSAELDIRGFNEENPEINIPEEYAESTEQYLADADMNKVLSDILEPLGFEEKTIKQITGFYNLSGAINGDTGSTANGTAPFASPEN